MNAPARLSVTTSSGLERSAALMRALGPRASSVWSALSPAEATQLTAAMNALPDDTAREATAAQTYLRDLAAPAPALTIWQKLADQEVSRSAKLLQKERPHVVAAILAQLPSKTAADIVRELPTETATPALRHLLHLGPVHASALKAIEMMLEQSLALTPSTEHAGAERIARILDNLDTRAEQGLLAALDGAEPGIGERIRALMFTFDDIAHLDPASLQTILASIDRSILVLALKGARPETADAFLNNMTQRARELLNSEIDMLGPVRRGDIDNARSELTALARELVKRGDILIHAEDEELIE